jgi:hypothetical protein
MSHLPAETLNQFQERIKKMDRRKGNCGCKIGNMRGKRRKKNETRGRNYNLLKSIKQENGRIDSRTG